MDGLGNLTETSGSFPVAVAFLDETGARVRTDEIALNPGTSTYCFSISAKPVKVVLDPDYWYLAAEREKTIRQVK